MLLTRIRLEHFRTKLGRRIVSLFLLCAFLATAPLVVLSFYNVRSELLKHSREAMHSGTYSAQMALYERLQGVESEVVFLTASPMVDQALAGEAITPGRGDRLRRISALTLHADGETTPLIGDLTVVPQLSAETLAGLARGQSALEVVRRGDAPPEILMGRALDRDDDQTGVLWGRIVGDSLWASAQVYAIDLTAADIDYQEGKGYCVLDASLQPLDCAGALVAWTNDGLPEGFRISNPVHASPSWSSGGERFEGHYRRIPLFLGYNTENWTVVVGRAESEILEPLIQFGRTLAGLLVLALMTVFYISAHRIREILEPLAELRKGTQRIAAKDFSARVRISSGDEFEELAASFNDMASQVGSLVEELEDLSWSTITTLARTIDAKSSWTAGHSERVTKMSIRIAEVLGLSEKELERLHRGGLLHDIGKIGVPASIIDKKGPLTEVEMQKMRDHVTIGASILEPLAPMADVIPIVLYHHERWDGEGYPHRLAGTDIPWLARILCVADTYDAMRSDRPYRAGMGPDETLEEIALCSGSQFDPEVVRAFVEGQAMDARDLPPLVSTGRRSGASSNGGGTTF